MRLTNLLVAAAAVALSSTLGAQQATAPPDAPTVDPSVTTVISGGQWIASDSTSGAFRVIVRSEGWEEVRHRVFVEWLEDDAAQRTMRVRATRELGPLAERAWSLEAPQLTHRAGRWYVTVRAAMRPLAQTTRRFAFVIGAPGEIQRTQSR